MSMMEEFLELQEKAAKLEKELKEKEKQIDVKDEKLLTLTENLNNSANEMAQAKSDSRHFRSLVSVLESEKKSLEREKTRLEKTVDSLNNQITQLAKMVETINKTLETKEESLLSKETQLQSKDNQLVEKNDKLEEYQKKMEEKFELMEKISDEKVKLTEKIAVIEIKLQETEQKFKNVKSKSRRAQDGLLGASMEMENVREENARLSADLQETTIQLNKYQRIKEILEEKYGIDGEKLLEGDEEKPSSLDIVQDLELDEKDAEKMFERDTGIYRSVSTVIAHFKFKIANLKRTLRLILPKLSDIEKFGLEELFLSLPKNALKNIACTVDKPKNKKLLKQLQDHNFRITDYREKTLFALSLDNHTASLAVYDEEHDKLTGLFSNEPDLVNLLSQAVMNPFIKGKKIN